MKPFIFLILFLICWVGTVVANDTFPVDGEGKFYSRPSDSLTFVKRQLLASSIEDIYSKELKALGLNPELFWEKYNQKFEEYMQPIKESLQKKYEVEGDATKVDHHKKEAYEDALREKRLELRAKFGVLNKALRSYSEKRQSRGTQTPNMRYLSIAAKVDRQYITKVYYRFMSNRELRKFSKLLVSTDFYLEGMDWKDMGVEVSTDFTDVVREHWKNWLVQNLKTNFNEVAMASVSEEEEISRIFSHFETASNIFPSDGKGPYEGVLWLKIKLILSKKIDDPLNKKLGLGVDGDFILYDIKNHEIMGFYDFVPEAPVFDISDNFNLSSNIASLVYRMPLSGLMPLNKRVSSMGVKSGKVFLALENIQNVQDIFSFQDLISIKGAGLEIVPRLKSYDGKTGQFEASYHGQNADLTKFLKSLDSQAIESKVLSLKDPANPFVLILKREDSSKTE